MERKKDGRGGFIEKRGGGSLGEKWKKRKKENVVFPSSPGTSHDLFNNTLFVSYKSLVLPPRRIRDASILDILSPSVHSSYMQKAREKHGFQMRGRKQRKGMKGLQGWRCRLLYKVMGRFITINEKPLAMPKAPDPSQAQDPSKPIHPVWPAGDSSTQYYNNYAHTINPYYGGINRLSGDLPI